MTIDGEYVDLSDEVISVDRWNGNAFAVYWNGKPTRRFFGVDARVRAMGHAMALMEGRCRTYGA